MEQTAKQTGSSLLIGYLYFIQGMILALPATIPLTYSKLPDYSMFSLFSSALLPYNFKFLSGKPLDIQLHSSKHTPPFLMAAEKHGSSVGC
jgi:hypothetical protein